MSSNTKDSGIEYIGEIPEDWDVKKIKFFSDIFGRIGFRGYTVSDLVDEGEGAITLSPSNIENQKLILNDVQYLSWFKYEESPEIKIFNNDVLLVKTASVGKVAFVENLNKPTTINPQFVVFKNIKINPKYFYYCLVSPVIQTQIELSLNGGVVFTLSQEHISNYYCVIPNEKIQNDIVKFLDKKINIIDIEIDRLKYLIEKYEEYKQTLITEAVTRGLDKEVKLVKSQAPWMPLIPEHWESAKFKFHLQADENKGFPNLEVLSLYRDYGVIPKNSRDDNHNVTSEDTSNYKHVVKGNFVVNKMKAWQGSVAVSEYEGIISPAYYVYKFISNEINLKYFHYLIRNKSYTPEFRRLSGGIREGQWDLPRYALENIIILIPPKKEQKEIVEFLDKNCKLIDSLILEKQQLINKLEEYKQSFIFEYVTGKKEVPK